MNIELKVRVTIDIDYIKGVAHRHNLPNADTLTRTTLSRIVEQVIEQGLTGVLPGVTEVKALAQ